MGAQFGLILIIIAIAMLIVYFLGESKKGKGAKDGKANVTPSNLGINTKDLKKNLEMFKTGKGASSGNSSTGSRARYTKNSKADVSKKDLFEFMEFDKIQDDMIVQDKGTKFTMVLQCKGINYDLMSEVEQLAVEEGFITFLNTLKSPIQLYVQARAIDLKTSLDMYKERVVEFNKEYEEISEEYNKLANDMSTPEEELRAAQMDREKMFNISEYAHDITRYVERLSLNKHMLQRKFYVVISYYKSEISTSTKFNDDELFDICYRELYTRAQGVISSLQTCSVSARVLDSNELAELIYITYNRDDQRLLDIRTALDSGFYRLYTTSKDVQEKRNELIKKQIQEEAMSRLEIALRTAIDKGTIITEDERVDAFENDVDKTAILMAEEMDIPQDIKEEAEAIIINGHRQSAAQRKKERAKRDEEIIKKVEEGNKSSVISEDTLEENMPEENQINESKIEDSSEIISDDEIISGADENTENEEIISSVEENNKAEDKSEDEVITDDSDAKDEASVEDSENDSIV
ncbi:MAG: hypothetical protein IJ809_03600 [Clostridia bacterium]|nr:hypothetical protein [Clostridia bacterium]